MYISSHSESERELKSGVVTKCRAHLQHVCCPAEDAARRPWPLLSVRGLHFGSTDPLAASAESGSQLEPLCCRGHFPMQRGRGKRGGHASVTCALKV